MAEQQDGRTYVVYVLIEPRPDHPEFLLPKYIGHANDADRREYEHHNPKPRWLWDTPAAYDYVEWERELKGRGFKPIMGIIWDHMTKTEAIWLEGRLISRALDLGRSLLNLIVPARER